jgi:hypothetical protein
MRRRFSLFTAATVVCSAIAAVPAAAAAPLTVVYTLTPDRTTPMDAAHPTLKISGTLTTQGAVPLVQHKVAFQADGDAKGTFSTDTTDSDGAFTVTYRPSGSAQNTVTISGAVPPDLDDAEAYTAPDQVVVATVVTTPTVLTLTTPGSTDIGSATSVSGTLTAAGNGLGGTDVKITGNGLNGCKADTVTATTDSGGDYRATVRPPCKLDGYTATAVPDGLNRPATVTAALFVRDHWKIKSKASIDPAGKVKVSGSVTGTVPYADLSLPLRYSANGRSKWKTIKTLKTDANGGYAASFTYKHAGYWRVEPHGSPTTAYTAGPRIKAWRDSVRMVSFKLSPTKTKFKKKINLSGVFQRKDAKGHWKPWSKRTLHIWFTCPRDTGKARYGTNKTVRTDSRGRFKKKITAYCTGDVYVEFDATPKSVKHTFTTASRHIHLSVPGYPPVNKPNRQW